MVNMLYSCLGHFSRSFTTMTRIANYNSRLLDARSLSFSFLIPFLCLRNNVQTVNIGLTRAGQINISKKMSKFFNIAVMSVAMMGHFLRLGMLFSIGQDRPCYWPGPRLENEQNVKLITMNKRHGRGNDGGANQGVKLKKWACFVPNPGRNESLTTD